MAPAFLPSTVSHFDGQPIRLIVQAGIWKPVVRDAALSIRTGHPSNDLRPYTDDVEGGVVHYKLRFDPNVQPTAPRSHDLQLTLTYLAVAWGVYVPCFPVWLVEAISPP